MEPHKEKKVARRNGMISGTKIKARKELGDSIRKERYGGDWVGSLNTCGECRKWEARAGMDGECWRVPGRT